MPEPEMFDRDDEAALCIIMGWAIGASMRLKEPLPVGGDRLVRLMRNLGIENPEQYLSALNSQGVIE